MKDLVLKLQHFIVTLGGAAASGSHLE